MSEALYIYCLPINPVQRVIAMLFLCAFVIVFSSEVCSDSYILLAYVMTTDCSECVRYAILFIYLFVITVWWLVLCSASNIAKMWGRHMGTWLVSLKSDTK